MSLTIFDRPQPRANRILHPHSDDEEHFKDIDEPPQADASTQVANIPGISDDADDAEADGDGDITGHKAALAASKERMAGPVIDVMASRRSSHALASTSKAGSKGGPSSGPSSTVAESAAPLAGAAGGLAEAQSVWPRDGYYDIDKRWG